MIRICLLALLSSLLFAVELPQQDKSHQAVNKALKWLQSQQREDGSIQDGDYRCAMTALCINAHLSSGITYHDTKVGPWLKKSLSFVLQMQDGTGYFGARDKSNMYGHGICTLMLAESIGMTGDPNMEARIRSALTRAIEVTVQAGNVKKAKKFRGGWHYNPTSDQSDMSLSGWQLLSLHGAQHAGFEVPESAINKGITYTRQLCNPKKGTVGYNDVNAARTSLRGVGLLCLTIRKNEADTDLSKTIATAIRNDPIEWKGPWFFYRAYYDVAGLGRSFPDYLDTYKKHVHNALLPHQDKEGWWHTPPGDNEGKYGKVYRTALAVLALTLDRQLLPAYQP